MKKVLTKKGFTLIELIVVIGILAVLAVVLIPSIMNYVGEAREARNTANARAIYSEVSASAAMGTLTVAEKTAGGVACNWTNGANGSISNFKCTVVSSSDGTFENGATTYTP